MGFEALLSVVVAATPYAWGVDGGVTIEQRFAPPEGFTRVEAEAGSFAHRSRFVAPYVRIKARRCGTNSTAPPANTKRLILPTSS